jgi:hypothetical protein
MKNLLLKICLIFIFFFFLILIFLKKIFRKTRKKKEIFIFSVEDFENSSISNPVYSEKLILNFKKFHIDKLEKYELQKISSQTDIFIFCEEDEKQEILNFVFNFNNNNKNQIKILNKSELKLGNKYIIFTEKFFQQKNEKILFKYFKKSNSYRSDFCFFQKFKENFEYRLKIKISSKKKNDLLSNIKFNLEDLYKFKYYEKYKSKYLVFNLKEELEFNKNYLQLKNNYLIDFNKQNYISKYYIDDILFEILKYLDMKTLIHKFLKKKN